MCATVAWRVSSAPLEFALNTLFAHSVHRVSSVLALGLLVVSAACGPTLQGLRHDPSFDFEGIQAGHIGVGGVTSLVHEADDQRAFCSQLSSMLRIQLLDAKGGFKVVPAGVFSNSLGWEHYEETLDQYRVSGDIPPEVLASWHAASGAASRYVVFARLEDDITTQNSEDGQEERDSTKYAYKKLSTKRAVTVAFNVYDMQTTKSVWSANLTDSKTNTTKFDRGVVGEDKDKSLLESVGEAIVKDIFEADYEYPGVPELTEVLDGVFEGFAKNMPQPPKK